MTIFINALVFCILQMISSSSGIAYDDSYYYGASGDDSYTPPSGPRSCRVDNDCFFEGANRYCCRISGKCCKIPTSLVYEDRSRCTRTHYVHGTVYTGMTCPPSTDRTRIHCCNDGYDCCGDGNLEKTEPDRRKNSLDYSGVTSMGAIAGFIFLAVIIVATLLTLATRYIKIKVRREHRRAGIHSQAYLDAVNRRSNGDSEQGQASEVRGNNNNAVPVQTALRQRTPDVFYIEPIAEEEDEENFGPPPSYDEAVSTCPVATDDDVMAERSPENLRRNTQFRPPMRANSSRLQRDSIESIPLSVRKGNYDPIQVQSEEEAEPGRPTFITLPKQQDSQA